VKDAVGFKLRPLRGGEYFEGGIRMAMFGHRPPMPKSRGGRKPRMGTPPPKKTIFLHEPIWFIIASVF
jgi:hypothetical protein